jgi:hypothetical protein
MEVLQRNSLCSYLKKAKMSFFLLLFLYKIKKQEDKTGPAEGVGTSGSREEVRKW